MSTVSLSSYNVVAAYRDLELADDAVSALLEAGVPEDRISLLGQPIEEVDRDAEKGPGEPIGGDVGKHIATGGATGSLAGGVLGALGTAAVAAIPGVGLVAGTGALIGAVAGAGAGGTVGAIIEGESAMRSDHSWNNAFDAIKDGAVVVGVHADDRDELDPAIEVLEKSDPMEIHRLNDKGEQVEAS